jgi:hypothetical protein
MMFEARRPSTRPHRDAAAFASAFSAFALVIVLVGFAGATNASAQIITRYDILNADVSGTGSWSHTYSGTITPTTGTRADYSGGTGTMTDGVILGTDLKTTQLFFNAISTPVTITLFLDGTHQIDELDFFGGMDPGNTIPGAIDGMDITINGVTATFTTIPFGPVNSLNPTNLRNDGVVLAGSALAGVFTDQIVISNVTANESGSPSRRFSITEIVVNGSLVSTPLPTPTPAATPAGTPTPTATPTLPPPPPPGAHPDGLVWVYYSEADDGTPGCASDDGPCGISGGPGDAINLYIDGGRNGGGEGETVCRFGADAALDNLCGADILIEMQNGHFTGIEPTIDTLVCNPSCADCDGICPLPSEPQTTRIRMNFRRGDAFAPPGAPPVGYRRVATLIVDSSGDGAGSPTKVFVNGVGAVGVNLQLRPIANAVEACTGVGEPFSCCSGEATSDDGRWPCGPRLIVPTKFAPEPGQFLQLLSGLAGLGCLYRLRRRG